MTKNFNVSQSRVNTYQACLQKYHYRYREKLVKKVKPRPLQFGSIIHDMVDAGANKKEPFKVLAEVATKQKQMFREQRELYGDIIGDIGYIMRAYYEYWKNDPLVYIKKEGRYAEHPVEMELEDGLVFKGRIDGFASNKGMKWLVEHKSHKDFPNDDHRWRNLQTCIYIPITEMYGWGKLDGTVWDYIRSRPPTRPQVLKNGELSRRQLDSLPEVVMDVIKENNLKLSDYGELIKSQIANIPSYFARVYTPVKSKVIKMIFDDFLTTAREMAEDKRKVTRTIGNHCSWCDYESICRAKLQGNDEDFVKEREFDHEEATQKTAQRKR